MKLPAIWLLTGDWLQDAISGCSLTAQGLWLRMMFVMHTSERRGYLLMNGLAMTDEYVASRCGVSVETYRTVLSEILASGTPKRTSQEWAAYSEGLPYGIIFNKRMVDDEDKRQGNKTRKRKSRASHGSVTDLSHGSSYTSSKPPPYPPPGENGDSALELSAEDAGLGLCHLMGLNGFQMRQLAKGACESAKRRHPELRMTEIPMRVQSLWREYDGQSTHVKVSLRTFLGEIGRFMDSDGWRKQEKTEIGRGYVPPPKAKGTGA